MDKTKTAFIAIVGKPNVGKSTLLNQLLGRKVSIISSKPQTTRNRIMGILTKGNSQYVFIDTPGLHIPKTKLGEIMVGHVKSSIGDIDGAILVVEPTERISPAENELIDKFTKRKIPTILLINKIDTLKDKNKILSATKSYKDLMNWKAVIPLSALRGEGIDILKAELETLLVCSPFYFDSDSYTDQPERVIVSEIIREKILHNLDKEIPHGIAVCVEKMKEREGKNIMDIAVTIYCEKESHKGIIIGKKGLMLQKIGRLSREELEDFFNCKINLQCWIKVKEDWRRRAGAIHNLELDL